MTLCKQRMMQHSGIVSYDTSFQSESKDKDSKRICQFGTDRFKERAVICWEDMHRICEQLDNATSGMLLSLLWLLTAPGAIWLYTSSHRIKYKSIISVQKSPPSCSCQPRGARCWDFFPQWWNLKVQKFYMGISFQTLIIFNAEIFSGANENLLSFWREVKKHKRNG